LRTGQEKTWRRTEKFALAQRGKKDILKMYLLEASMLQQIDRAPISSPRQSGPGRGLRRPASPVPAPAAPASAATSAKAAASPPLAIEIGELVLVVVAAFRRHPHINNVLTHISGADWGRVEAALRAILDPQAGSRDLSPLARNIIDLMCADRGVTGRILKPYYREVLVALLGERVAKRFITHVTCLFMESALATRGGARGGPAR
jgi:hypothetical protein